MKTYHGTVPPCGVFCGGCPLYLRSKSSCPGAEISQRCASKNCRFYKCATEKGLSFCHECAQYPCSRFKRFAATWVKYGQDFLENQKELQTQGTENFLKHWNAAACEGEAAESYE